MNVADAPGAESVSIAADAICTSEHADILVLLPELVRRPGADGVLFFEQFLYKPRRIRSIGRGTWELQLTVASAESLAADLTRRRTWIAQAWSVLYCRVASARRCVGDGRIAVLPRGSAGDVGSLEWLVRRMWYGPGGRPHYRGPLSSIYLLKSASE